mgnify:CR=1 FL=1
MVAALKRSDLYGSLWKSCDELRDRMDARQCKDYILASLFVKYVSDEVKAVSDDQRATTASLCATPPLRRARG